MAEEIVGRGDPIRALELMWGRAPAPKRGPKSRVGVADLVAAAVAIADAEGIGAVSTRRVAEAVGISPMSFYTHIPDKAVLLDLMLDAVAIAQAGELAPDFQPANWRANVTLVARSFRRFYLAHPWALEIGTHRPVLGPNTIRAYDTILGVFDGLGLSAVEMDFSVTLVANYVHGAVRDVVRASMVKAQTGMSDDEWWYTIAPFMETIDFSPYPVASRVGAVVGELYGLGNPDLAFDFGLERILDGLQRLIEGKRGGPTVERG
ncbi:TetR/AcrR family transcriptional regulator [Devosia sp. A16]|uniref:TetR/AcrR family transcriptional regulator n=1 Tax=Devosia sp. A16 TaxID=1736675 RepID=UPI0006D79FCB|nr:TetR/AcrR family transcriptional regulator [Devosia sp. A16]